jgi:hypothetical protein
MQKLLLHNTHLRTMMRCMFGKAPHVRHDRYMPCILQAVRAAAGLDPKLQAAKAAAGPNLKLQAVRAAAGPNPKDTWHHHHHHHPIKP